MRMAWPAAAILTHRVDMYIYVCTAYADVLVLQFYSLLFSGRIFCSVSAFDVRAQRFETVPERHAMNEEDENEHFTRTLYNSSTLCRPYWTDYAHFYSISFGRKATKKKQQQQLYSYKTKETIQCILVFHFLLFFCENNFAGPLQQLQNEWFSTLAIDRERGRKWWWLLFLLFFAFVVLLRFNRNVSHRRKKKIKNKN